MSFKPRKIPKASDFLPESAEKTIDKKKIFRLLKPQIDAAETLLGAYEFGQRLREEKEPERNFMRNLSGLNYAIPDFTEVERPINIGDSKPTEKDLRGMIKEPVSDILINRNIRIPKIKPPADDKLKNIKFEYGGLTNPVVINKEESKNISDINWDIYDKLAGINKTGELGSGNPLFDIPRWITSSVLKVVTPETYQTRKEKYDTGKLSIAEKKQRQDLLKYFENVENGKEAANILQQTLGKTATGFLSTVTGTIKGLDTFSQNLANIITGGIYSPDYENTAVQQALNKVNDIFTDWLAPTSKRYNIAGDIAQGIGSSLGFLATGKILPVFKNPTANIMLTGALTNGQSAFEETYKKTGNVEDAIRSFYINAVMGTSEALPLSKMMGRISGLKGLFKGNKFKEILKNASKQFIEEGTQEFSQALLQDIESMNYDKTKTIDDTVNNALYQGLVGGLSGFIMTGMGSLPGGFTIRSTKKTDNIEEKLKSAIIERPKEVKPQEIIENKVTEAQDIIKKTEEEPGGQKQVTIKKKGKLLEIPEFKIDDTKVVDYFFNYDDSFSGINEAIQKADDKKRDLKEKLKSVKKEDREKIKSQIEKIDKKLSTLQENKETTAVNHYDKLSEDIVNYAESKGLEFKNEEDKSIFIADITGPFTDGRFADGFGDTKIKDYVDSYIENYKKPAEVKSEKSNKYSITNDGKNFEEVTDAKPVKLDYEGDFFISKENGNNIYEKKTGYKVTSSFGRKIRTQKDAIENANEYIKEKGGQEGLERHIEKAIKKQKENKLYEEIENKTKTAKTIDELPDYTEKAYRYETGYTHPKGTKASDVVKFEREELGNDNNISKEVEKALKKYDARKLVWVSNDSEIPKKYMSEGENAEVTEVEIPKGSKIVGTDGEGGYLVLMGDKPELEKSREVPERIITKKELKKQIPQANRHAYEMTREEYQNYAYENKLIEKGTLSERETKAMASDIHRNAINKALSEGKTVPEEVLKDYPELKNKIKEEKSKKDNFTIQEGSDGFYIEGPDGYPVRNEKTRRTLVFSNEEKAKSWINKKQGITKTKDEKVAKAEKDLTQLVKKPVAVKNENIKVTEIDETIPKKFYYMNIPAWDNYISEKTKEYGSKVDFLASEEFKKVKPIYDELLEENLEQISPLRNRKDLTKEEKEEIIKDADRQVNLYMAQYRDIEKNLPKYKIFKGKGPFKNGKYYGMILEGEHKGLVSRNGAEKAAGVEHQLARTIFQEKRNKALQTAEEKVKGKSKNAEYPESIKNSGYSSYVKEFMYQNPDAPKPGETEFVTKFNQWLGPKHKEFRKINNINEDKLYNKEEIEKFEKYLKQFRKKENEKSEKPRNTEIIESEVKAIEEEITDNTEAEEDRKKLPDIERLIDEIDSKLGELKASWSTEGVAADYPIDVVSKEIKKNVNKYARETARILSWEIAKDKKGKPHLYANIPPAGGEVVIHFAIPNTPLEMYVAVNYDPGDADYSNYNFNGFFYRVENPNAKGQDKYVGGNQWQVKNLTPKEFAKVLLKEAKPYIEEETGKAEITKSKEQIEKLYDEDINKYEAAKKEIDDYADSLVKESNTKRVFTKVLFVIKAGLKSKERTVEKAITEAMGDYDAVTDVARNTIVVNGLDDIDNVMEKIKKDYGEENIIKFLNISRKPAKTGYRGALVVIKTKSGKPAEIQVNTPEITISKGDIPKEYLQEDVFKDISENIEDILKTKELPIGLGHLYYEAIRGIVSVIQNNRDAGKEDNELIKFYEDITKESKKYYDLFDALLTARLNVSSDISSAKSKAREMFAAMDLESVIKELERVEKTKDLPPGLSSILTKLSKSFRQYVTLDSMINTNKKSVKSQEKTAVEINKKVNEKYQGLFNNELRETVDKYGANYIGTPKSVRSIVSKLGRHERAGRTEKFIKDAARGLIVAKIEDFPDIIRDLKVQGFNAEIYIDKPYNEFGYRSVFLQKDYGEGIGGLLQLLTDESSKIKEETDKIYRKWRDREESEIKKDKEEYQEYLKDKKYSNKIWSDFWENISEKLKNEIKNTPSKIKEKISKIDKSLDDAWGDLLQTAKDKKIYSNMPVDPEILTKSINIVRLYVEKGVYKFADICLDAYERLGKEVFPKFFDALKRAYGSLHTSDLTDEVIDNLDGTEIVRKITLNNALDNIEKYYVNLKKKEKEDADNKRNNGKDGQSDELSESGRDKGDNTDALEEAQEESMEGADEGGTTGGKNKRRSTKDISSIQTGTGKNRKKRRDEGTASEEHGMGQSEGTLDNAGGPESTRASEPVIPIDYSFTDGDSESQNKTFSKRQRAIANVSAIETVNKIIAEKRLATTEEQKILSQYVGWGGIPEIFDENKEDWTELRNKLKSLVHDTDYKSARASTLNAHYTSPELIKAIYKALQNLGFTGGRILEPSAGIGHFFMLMPEEMKNSSKLHGIELDYYTGEIAKQLTQTAIWDVKSYADVKQYEDGYFDLIISNVPFGNYKVFDPNIHKNLKSRIHNYFFAKSINKVRDGGIIAFITSKGTLDALDNNDLRALIGKSTKFLGAVRLPNNAFLKNANTKVVTDVIFLQKNINKNNTGTNPDLKTSKMEVDGKEFHVNNYFRNNPEMVLGEFTAPKTGGLYGGNELTVEYKGDTFTRDLEYTLDKLKKNIYRDIDESMKVPEYTKKEYSIEINKYADGQFITESKDNNIQIFQIRNGAVEKIEFGDSRQALAKKDKTVKQIQMIELARDIMIQQSTSNDDSLYKVNMKKLNEIYDNYVSKYGVLNSKENKKILFSNFYGDDPYRAFLLSLENYDENTNTATKSDRFTKRTAHPANDSFKIENIRDALTVSRNVRGTLDIDLISRVSNKPYLEVIAELKKDNLIFFDGDKYVDADEYLSGNVKKKLKKARKLLEKTSDSEYQRNIQELEKVIPADITPAEIRVNLGSEWVGANTYDEFIRDLLGLKDEDIGEQGVKVIFNNYKKDWTINGKDNFKGNSKNITEFGTEDANAIELLNLLLNNKKVQVFEYDKTLQKNVLNETKTFAAQAKQELIKEEFDKWIYRDEKRALRLGEIYNERFNNIAERKYDGSHLSLPGLNRDIADRLFTHVKDAVWRITQQRDVLLAHKVGLGKTWSMSIGAMELRRLGLAKKPLHIVKNTMVRQYANEFFMLYPNAKILVIYPDEIKGNAKLKRQIFLSKIANNEWDSIIIPNTFFTKLPVSPDVERAFLEEQVNELEEIIREEEDNQKAEGSRYKSRTVKQLEAIREEEDNQKAEGSRYKSRTVKQLEAIKENFEAKIKELLEKQKNKDLTVYYEDLGVDQLFVDEAHNYKNLFYVSRLQMRGLNKTNSVRALDLYLKTRILREKYKTGLVFATGTPIGNTIAEMFTMMRYINPKLLEEYGIDHFDSWINDFGRITNDYEVNVLGTGIQKVQRVSRFTNVRELSLLFRQNTDVKGFDDGIGEKNKPKLITGKAIELIAPKNEHIEAYLKLLASRYKECLKGKDPKEDNVLNVMTDGRKAAIDLRLVGIDMDYAQSKINISIPQIYEDWKHTEKDKGVMLLYISMGTPSGVKNYSKRVNELTELKSYIRQIKHKNLINIQNDIYKKLSLTDKESEVQDLTIKERLISAISRGKITREDVIKAIDDEIMIYESRQNAVSNINLYADIKKKLIDKGIPEKDIVFAQDFKTSVQRQELKDGMNSGKYRVVLTTKELLGEGSNVQRRLYAEYIYDPPHRPMDLEQMLGREIRNGNMFKEVKVYYLSSEGSFDTFMWDRLAIKSRFISQIMNNKTDVREVEDIDERTYSYAEMTALTSGNKDMIELQKYRDEYARLYYEYRGFMDNQYKIFQKQKSLPEEIKSYENILENLNKYAVPNEEYDLNNFELFVTGEKFEKANAEKEEKLRNEKTEKKQELKNLLLDYKDEETGKIKKFSDSDQKKYDLLNSEIKSLDEILNKSPRVKANKKIAEIAYNLIKNEKETEKKRQYIIGKYKNYDILLEYKVYKNTEEYNIGPELIKAGKEMVDFEISLIQKINPKTGKESYKVISGKENQLQEVNQWYNYYGNNNALKDNNSKEAVLKHLKQDMESGSFIVGKFSTAGRRFNSSIRDLTDDLDRISQDYNAVKDYTKKEFGKLERVEFLKSEIDRLEASLKVNEEIKQKTGNEEKEGEATNEEGLVDDMNNLEKEEDSEVIVEGIEDESTDKERQLQELEEELDKTSIAKKFADIIKSPYHIAQGKDWGGNVLYIEVPHARTLRITEYPDLELFIYKKEYRVGRKKEYTYVISEANTGGKLTDTDSFKNAHKSVLAAIEDVGGIESFKKQINNLLNVKNYKSPYYEENNKYKDIKVETEKNEETEKRKKVLEYLSNEETYSVRDLSESAGIDTKEASVILRDLYKADKLDKNENGEYKATEDYRALIADMQVNPHKYGTTLDKLYSNPVLEVVKGIGEGINFADDMWEKFIGDKLWNWITRATDITSKRVLGEKLQEKVKELIITNYGLPDAYLGRKREIMVMADYYKDLAKEIAEKLVYNEEGKKYSEAEQIRLGQIIKGGITSDPNLRKKADEVRTILKELHEKGKELKVLPIETYNEKLPRKRIHELLTWKAKYQAKLNKLIHESKGSVAADAEVNSLKNKIVNIDNKIKTSYKLGGTGYFKRAYASKEGIKNIEELMKKYGYLAEDGTSGDLITRDDILLKIPEIMDNDLKRKQAAIDEIEKKKEELNDKLNKLKKSNAKDVLKSIDNTLKKLQNLDIKLMQVEEAIKNRLPVQEISYKQARKMVLRGPGKSSINLKNFFDAISQHPVFASENQERGFELMPNDPRFGALAGKWVEKSIAEDIKGDFKQNIDRLTPKKSKLPTRLDLTSAIHRQDIPLKVRMELGEILTASYPTAKAIMLEGMDISLGNLFKYISEHAEYVSDEERADFVKMPDNDMRLGMLQGKYVDPRVAGDIEDMLEFTDEHFVDKFIKKLTAVWKSTKTVMNPATHMRNIMSASVFVDYSGINHVQQMSLLKPAFETLLGKGPYAADFKASGLKGTTFNAAELERFLGIMKEMDFKATFKEGWENFLGLGIADKIIKIYGKASLVDTKYGELMRSLYQNEDMFWKAMIFVDRRRKGYSIMQAREEANKWMFDYSEVPKLIEKLRSGSFLLGMPFISWSWKAFPRVAEASIKRPLTFWKYPLLFGLLTTAALKYLDIDDEEWEKIKTTLPDRLKKGQWILLPFRDDNNNLQLLDITYIVPYKDWYDVIQSGVVLASTGQFNTGDDIIEGITGFANNPIFTAVTELSANKNRFLNRSIWNDTDEPGEKLRKALDYMYKLWMPSLHPEIPGLTRGGYAYDKLINALFQRPDYQNRVFSLAPAISSSLLGLKVNPIEIEKFKDQHISKLKGEILELQRVKSQILKDDSINKEKRLEQAADYDRKIGKVEESIKMYEKGYNILPETFEGRLLNRTIKKLQEKQNDAEVSKRQEIERKINELKIDLDKIRQEKYGSKEDISEIKKNVIKNYDFTKELKNTKGNITRYINKGKEEDAEDEIKYLIEISKNQSVPQDVRNDISEFIRLDFKYWMQDRIDTINEDYEDRKITKEQAEKRKEMVKKLYKKYKLSN